MDASNGDPKIAFDAATRVFTAAPSADTLLLLNMTAGRFFGVTLPLPDTTQAAEFREPDVTDFTAIRATFDRTLTAAEQVGASAAIGYALRIYVGGGELPLPVVTESGRVLTFEYDSSDRRRTSPDYAECFAEAARFIQEGSPVRCSNRAGVGTKGTRLAEGIGKVGVTFTVR